MSDQTIPWTGYLVIKIDTRKSKYPRQWKASARLTAKNPSITRDEVAVKLAVELPASMFLRPSLEAKITVPDHQVTPLTIDLQTQDNIAELIRQNTGFDVRIIADGKEAP